MVRQRRTSPVVGALAVALLVGCSSARSGPGASEETVVSQRSPDTLAEFIAPTGSVPLPPSFADARVRFEAARVEYERRRQFAAAARHFLEAAQLLLPIEGMHASTAAANRLSCYRNAWSAFSAAGEREAGRTALSAAAQTDLVHAGRIRDLVGSP
jgi:hypothetical protein